MPDLLLLPTALLLALGLRAARRGDLRRHAHLMVAAFALLAVRVLLALPDLPGLLWGAGVGVLVCGGGTMALGRKALAWREGRSHQTVFPRFHRAAGATTLILLTLASTVWLMRQAR